MFDAQAFIQQSTDQASSTVYLVCPEGDYNMMIEPGDPAEWIKEVEIKKGQRAGQSMITVDIPVEVIDDNVRQKMGVQKVVTRYRMILDFDANGNFDFSEGKNVKLGKLRDALNQNQPGVSWNWSMLPGAGPFKGHVSQTSDKNNPEQKYAEVTTVSRL